MKELLSTAIVLMATRHDGQFDKGGKPYSLHPLKVMHYLSTDDIELMIIALFHDLCEDTDTTYQELRDMGFSERVIEGVRCITKVPGESFEEYQEKVLSNVDSMKVKQQDLRTNSDIRRLKGITEKDIRRIEKYHKFYVLIKTKLQEMGES